MPYYSAFWANHYKELRNCCMTYPLKDYPIITDPRIPIPQELENKQIIDLIDTNWMSEKKLKWFGWDVNGWLAWTDSSGMIYRIKDLKRNETGRQFEKKIVKIEKGGDPRDDIYASAKELYLHELNLQKDCSLCPPPLRIPEDDNEEDDNNNTPEQEDDSPKPTWEDYANGTVLIDYVPVIPLPVPPPPQPNTPQRTPPKLPPIVTSPAATSPPKSKPVADPPYVHTPTTATESSSPTTEGTHPGAVPVPPSSTPKPKKPENKKKQDERKFGVQVVGRSGTQEIDLPRLAASGLLLAKIHLDSLMEILGLRNIAVKGPPDGKAGTPTPDEATETTQSMIDYYQDIKSAKEEEKKKKEKNNKFDNEVQTDKEQKEKQRLLREMRKGKIAHHKVTAKTVEFKFDHTPFDTAATKKFYIETRITQGQSRKKAEAEIRLLLNE